MVTGRVVGALLGDVRTRMKVTMGSERAVGDRYVLTTVMVACEIAALQVHLRRRVGEVAVKRTSDVGFPSDRH